MSECECVCDKERGSAKIGFVAAKVTATPYHGISLSGCEMGKLILSNPAGRPRALFYFRATALAADRFHEMHRPWVAVSDGRTCRGQACMLAVEIEKDKKLSTAADAALNIRGPVSPAARIRDLASIVGTLGSCRPAGADDLPSQMD